MTPYTDAERTQATKQLAELFREGQSQSVILFDALLRANRAEAELRAAITEVSESRRAQGFAEGALRASAVACIVDGWRERAERAEAQLAEMTAKSATVQVVPDEVLRAAELWRADKYVYSGVRMMADFILSLAHPSTAAEERKPEVPE